MFAKITRDFLFETEDSYPRVITESRVGEVIFNQNPGETFTVRLLDDDLEVYYEASCDDEAMEPLFDWSQRDAGTTVLQQLNSRGEWEDVIS